MVALNSTTRPAALPLALIAQAIPKLSRHDLEHLTERLIDRLDEIDGDNDVELNGDEADCNGAEDDFCLHNAPGMPAPGCPLGDPDMDAEDYPIAFGFSQWRERRGLAAEDGRP